MNKARNTNYNKGFSTLEIMIAMVIILLAISAALLVSSGDQSILVDSQTNAEALNIAQKTLENEQALARKDFRLVNSNTSTETIGSITYTKDVIVTTDPTGANDFFTKKIVAKISWPGTFGRSPSVSLTSLVTNFENAIGGNTCDSNISGDWQNNADVKYTLVVKDPNTHQTDPITSIDAYKNRLYVTTNNSTANNATLYIYTIDTSNPSSPKINYLTSMDNDTTYQTGLKDIAIGEYTDTSNTKHTEAYVANASSINKQLQIIDVSTTPVVVSSLKLGTTYGLGNSIFYKNGYVYVGLTHNTANGPGPEFYIVDVHDPKNPVPLGSISIGNDINAIYVNGNYAYLATPNGQELAIIDISDPSNPTQVGGFDAPLGSGNGENIDVVGDDIYLGRAAGGNEFYLLDGTTVNPTALKNYDDGHKSINGLLVRDYLTFVLTNSQLQILNTGMTNPILQYSSPISLSSGTGTALDCEGNFIYAGTSTGHIDIISP